MHAYSFRPWLAGLASTFVLMLAGCSNEFSGAPPLGTQKNVDLARYAGVWYEQARLPNRFQKQCVDNVQARYQLQGQGLLVVNSCRNAAGQTEQAQAQGRLNPDTNDPARLQVRFAPQWLSGLPWVWADYWILRIDGDYDYALVGTPDRDYLWVLSRMPQADEARVQALLDYAAAQRFDVSNMIRTRQLPD
ncbi:lipocalin family protein [Alcaligenes sp. SDU_A2]|uniref:lipocalin family protein n=1 Tax=Alcaligenes sp. SDU_A2 TaxID=3136634 RepID=UPI002C006317|nr:lipocalin family protein [Alcaligenes sp.]HRL27136.1 lipocalin family protein [Alcaligenes sp.]